VTLPVPFGSTENAIGEVGARSGPLEVTFVINSVPSVDVLLKLMVKVGVLDGTIKVVGTPIKGLMGL
jgi:hypothetical protein